MIDQRLTLKLIDKLIEPRLTLKLIEELTDQARRRRRLIGSVGEEDEKENERRETEAVKRLKRLLEFAFWAHNLREKGEGGQRERLRLKKVKVGCEGKGRLLYFGAVRGRIYTEICALSAYCQYCGDGGGDGGGRYP